MEKSEPAGCKDKVDNNAVMEQPDQTKEDQSKTTG